MQYGFLCRNVSETSHSIVVVVAAAVVVVVGGGSGFNVALVSALKETHCAHVSCDSEFQFMVALRPQ